MNNPSGDSSRVGDRAISTSAAKSLPRALDPVITMEAVQRYVETERVRNRRIVIWTSTAFLLVLLIVLIVFVSIGILVLSNSRKAMAIVEQVRHQAQSGFPDVAALSNRIANVANDQAAILEEVKRGEDVRLKDSEQIKADVDRLGRMVEWQTSGSGTVALVEARLTDLERLAAAWNRDLAELKARGSAAPVAVSPREGAESPPPAEVSAERTIDRGEADAGTALPEDLTAQTLSTSAVFQVEEVASPQPAGGAREVSVVTFPNGDRYEGEFKDGLFNGWGLYFYRNGDRYEGEFRDDMKNGRGTLIYQNGDRYVGDFKDDMRSGKGSLAFQNGDRYVGAFANDMMNGKGTLLYQNGNRYAGDFRNGLKHGNGVFLFANGDMYKGELRDDLRNGKGTYTFSDGSRYVGDFEAGKRHGKGRYVYGSGEEYVGEFKDGQRNGFGVCTYPDGRVIKGVWQADRFIRSSEGP